MDAIQKAKELGEALQNSEEFKAMQVAEINYRTDEEAQRLTALYNEKHEQLTAELRKEDIKPLEMIKIRQQLSKEAAALRNNEVIRNYLDKKQAAENLLSEVNSIIHYFVTGEEEEESGCGGSCDSCGGCH